MHEGVQRGGDGGGEASGERSGGGMSHGETVGGLREKKLVLKPTWHLCHSVAVVRRPGESRGVERRFRGVAQFG